MVKQCMVAVIRHQTRAESWAPTGRDLQQSKLLVLSTEVEVEKAKCEQLERVVIDDYEEKFFQVGVQLPHRERQELIDFLRKNIDVFTWSVYKASRVDPNFICHRLKVNPSAIPKKQPPQHLSREHSNAVKEEVLKLKWVKAIKEMF